VTKKSNVANAAGKQLMPKLRPYFEDVQAHYDLSDDFYKLFLDESMTYSCGYFERDDYTLAQAQAAKVDLSLGKCQLQKSMTLLDVGCGWGATAMRAASKYDCNVIGLTLSKNQLATAQERAAHDPRIEFRLQGWEEFDEPVDRIVSIGAFEHFRWERHRAFFEKCYQLLPADGRMMCHTILYDNPPLDLEFIAYIKFIAKQIFPGGQLPSLDRMKEESTRAGFKIEKIQSLQQHYAKTLDCWAANLKAREEEAVTIANREVVDRYFRYLRESAHYFRIGKIDVCQFTLTK
jgi:cyclopropane-fatty-acyl-phospholipid synthase